MGRGGDSPCTKYCKGSRCRVLLQTNKFAVTQYLQKLVVGDGTPVMR